MTFFNPQDFRVGGRDDKLVMTKGLTITYAILRDFEATFIINLPHELKSITLLLSVGRSAHFFYHTPAKCKPKLRDGTLAPLRITKIEYRRKILYLV